MTIKSELSVLDRAQRLHDDWKALQAAGVTFHHQPRGVNPRTPGEIAVCVPGAKAPVAACFLQLSGDAP